MKTILKEKYLTVFIIISMIAFPLFELIGVFFNQKFFLQEQTLTLIGIIGYLLIIIALIFELKKKDKLSYKFVLSDFFILTSIVFCIISIIFSKSIKKSLIGTRGYSETPFQVLGYFTLFVLSTMISEEKNKKSILITFLILGILEAIVAFLQNFGLWPIDSYFDTSWHKHDHLAFGFTQHCNFFAPVATIFTALFATKFIYSKTKKEQFFCLFGAVICCISTFFTYTRLGWLGILATLIGITVLELSLYFSKKDKLLLINHLKKFSIILVCFFICFFIVGNTSGQIQKDITQSKNELTAKKIDSFGTGRGQVWRAGLSALKKYPFTGVGFDIYNFSFFASSDPSINISFQNKGHNEYLHTFVTQGIFSGINYMAFAFYCCYFAYKKILHGSSDFSQSDLTKFFLIAVFAYFVQALFNSSVTNVAVYKWILMGLVLPRWEQTDLKSIYNKIKQISKKEIQLYK